MDSGQDTFYRYLETIPVVFADNLHGFVSLTAVPAIKDGLACAGAPHKRRRPVGLAKLCALRTLFPRQSDMGKGYGAKHRKRDCASGLMARPRGG